MAGNVATAAWAPCACMLLVMTGNTDLAGSTCLATPHAELRPSRASSRRLYVMLPRCRPVCNSTCMRSPGAQHCSTLATVGSRRRYRAICQRAGSYRTPGHTKERLTGADSATLTTASSAVHAWHAVQSIKDLQRFRPLLSAYARSIAVLKALSACYTALSSA